MKAGNPDMPGTLALHRATIKARARFEGRRHCAETEGHGWSLTFMLDGKKRVGRFLTDWVELVWQRVSDSEHVAPTLPPRPMSAEATPFICMERAVEEEAAVAKAVARGAPWCQAFGKPMGRYDNARDFVVDSLRAAEPPMEQVGRRARNIEEFIRVIALFSRVTPARPRRAPHAPT